MGLTAGIVGLPNVGKSTLFNAITKSHVLAANYPFATIDPNVGVVEVKDERLDRIVEMVKPRNVVRATVSFTDIAGLVKGASLGEGLGNQFLSHIREVDAICQVVRCFDDSDVIHVTGKIDPINDIETINLELVLADLDIVQKRIPRIEKKAQLKVEKDAETEYLALNKIKKVLEEGHFATCAHLNEEEMALVKNYSLLTLKPMIYVLNISEQELNHESDYVKKVRTYAESTATPTVVISAKIEEEISGLDEETKQMFLSDLGMTESGLDL
nr:redox-regulated ATPase YchF [Bacilli bacterium]